MSAGDEFIMPVSKPDAVAEMHLHALRQISDALAQTNRSLDLANQKQDALAGAVQAMSVKVARLEERDVRAEVKALAVRIDALERVKDVSDGARSVGGWFSRNMSWLLALAEVKAVLAGRTGSAMDRIRARQAERAARR